MSSRSILNRGKDRGKNHGKDVLTRRETWMFNFKERSLKTKFRNYRSSGNILRNIAGKAIKTRRQIKVRQLRYGSGFNESALIPKLSNFNIIHTRYETKVFARNRCIYICIYIYIYIYTYIYIYIYR